jgi:hypothetical protein
LELHKKPLNVRSAFLRHDICHRTRIEILRKYFTDDDFKAILDDPASGIFDRSSWAKWNERYNRTPVPPLSKRKIADVDPATIAEFFPPKY